LIIFFFFFSARGVINIDNSLFIGKKQKKQKQKQRKEYFGIESRLGYSDGHIWSKTKEKQN
jgi:hypothetical protein